MSSRSLLPVKNDGAGVSCKHTLDLRIPSSDGRLIFSSGDDVPDTFDDSMSLIYYGISNVAILLTQIREMFIRH